MQPARWNMKKVTIFGFLAIFFYTIFSSGYNQYSESVVIKKTKPDEVWGFVADFSKMRILNPTIVDFTVTSDRGMKNERWKYSIIYRERLSHWPYWINVSSGNFSIYKLTPQEGGQYVIDSEHRTCFFNGNYCLKSKGNFQCQRSGLTDSYCIETVYFQCPPFLGAFCRREVQYQRKAIMQNLVYHFSKRR